MYLCGRVGAWRGQCGHFCLRAPDDLAHLAVELLDVLVSLVIMMRLRLSQARWTAEGLGCDMRLGKAAACLLVSYR